MATPGALPELEGEDAGRFESPTGHAALRTIQSLGGGVLGVAALQGSLFVPGVARLLGVSVLDGAVTCGLVIAGMILATGAYWIGGFSRLYAWAEYAESVLAAAGYSNLIYASNTPQSLFWVLYLAHVFVLGSTGTALRNGVLLGVAPAALALGFGLKGEIAAASVSLLAGACGVALYPLVGRSFDELEAVRRREVALKGTLARLRVTQERDRIARDLHDGVGAGLAGLIWRVRRLASSPASPPSPEELEKLELRVLDTIEELRDVVLALRREPMAWDEVTARIRTRCQELCGTIQFHLAVDGAPAPATVDAVFSDLVRIVFELVRNAVRHGAPSKIDVRIEAARDLRVRVSDDGQGFQSADAAKSQGGLANVRRRLDDLGGRMDVASDAGGTRVEIVLPAVSNAPSVT